MNQPELALPKPTKPPVVSLERGWLLPYLFTVEDALWKRWQHWHELMLAKDLRGPIPQIQWQQHPSARKMLEHSLSAISHRGDWQGWGSWRCIDYLFDWLLFGFGHSRQLELPQEPEVGACERLHRVFDLQPLITYPHDYFGDILADNRHGRQLGFFPTPMDLARLMVEMQLTGEDCRKKSVCDPALGTGRMLLCASNHSYCLYGNDVNLTVIKATLINGYLYAPWLVKPFPFLCKSP